VGLKILYPELLSPRLEEAITWLLADPQLRVVHLHRRDSFRRYLSEQVLHAGGAIHSRAGGRRKKRVRVEIDPREFQRRSAELEKQAERAVARLANRQIMDVCYEDLAVDPGGEVAGVCAFLGVEAVADDIEPALDKVGASDPRDVISNYEELLDNPVTRDFLLPQGRGQGR